MKEQTIEVDELSVYFEKVIPHLIYQLTLSFIS